MPITVDKSLPFLGDLLSHHVHLIMYKCDDVHIQYLYIYIYLYMYIYIYMYCIYVDTRLHIYTYTDKLMCIHIDVPNRPYHCT